MHLGKVSYYQTGRMAFITVSVGIHIRVRICFAKYIYRLMWLSIQMKLVFNVGRGI